MTHAPCPSRREFWLVLLAASLLAGCAKEDTAAPAPAPAQAPAQAPDSPVLHDYLDSAVGSLDPAMASDLYINRTISQTYETLLEYHYLKRPYALEPCLADGMPTTNEDGTVWTIKLKRGVRYQDDPCFPGGKGRELKSADFAVAWKRLADAELSSPGWWIFDGKIAGLNDYRTRTGDKAWREGEIARTGKKHGHLLAEVAGIATPDDHTLVVTLTQSLPIFQCFLAMHYTAPVPIEALEHYGKEIASHAVGTGPYVITHFDGNSKIVYAANPSYREVLYPSEGAPGDQEAGRLADAGRRLPLVPNVEVSVIVEDLPRWLEFTAGNLDRYSPTPDVFDKIVARGGKELTSTYRAQGMELEIYEDIDVVYTAFNMEDPLLGQNVYLRRALSLAVDTEEEIRELRNGRAISAHGPIPPGIFGYRDDRRSPYRKPDDMKTALDEARALMERAGFPGGKGLPKLQYASTPGEVSRLFDDHLQRSWAKIGVELEIQVMSWPEFDELLRGKRGQVWGVAWGADYADPENFLQLLYGQNVSPGPNAANYKNARFDELYPKMLSTPDGPERQAIIDEMVKIVQEDCPWVFGTHRRVFAIRQGWLGNYKYHPLGGNYLRFYDVDSSAKARLSERLR